MNYPDTIDKLNELALDRYDQASEFCKAAGRSKSWWSNVTAGRRRLDLLGPDGHAVTSALGVELQISVNGTVEYNVYCLENVAAGSVLNARSCNKRRYSALWTEFSTNNHLDEGELDIQAIWDYIHDEKQDGARVMAADGDLERFKRAFYRYLREFDGMPVSEINGNRFPVQEVNFYDGPRRLDWSLTGEDNVPF